MCGMSIPVTAYGNNNDMDLLQAIIIKKLQKVWPDMTGLGSRKKGK